ncbi:MAG: HAD-IA family hydrolase [Trueperaceae bacterium]|nr:HAD-IA family hydrolase [Trueperaceae bacterium]
MTKLPTLVFDLDGTLVDSSPDIIASFQATLKAYGYPEPPAQEVKALIGRPLREMYAVYAEEQHIDSLVFAYREHYPQHFVDNSSLFPSVLETLEALRSRGFACVVATTKESSIARLFCDALGLSPLLNHIQGTDDFPAKPAPHVIFKGLEAIKGQGLWMVGDTIHDIEAGKAAGLKTYAVSWGTHDAAMLAQAKPTALSDDLSALPGLLKS